MPRRITKAAICALAISLASAVLAAAPAADAKSRHPAPHLMPRRSGTVGSARVNPLLTPQLQFYGGPVMWQPTRTVPIFWEPAVLQDGTPESVSPNFNALVTRFFQDVGGHALYNDLTQYYASNSSPNNFIVNASGVLQAIVDTSPYPAATGGCAADSVVNCITDDQLQAEITSQIAAAGLPTDLRTVYPVFTDPMESSCIDAHTCYHPDGLSDTNWVYCAYHGEFDTPSGPVIYANLPYLNSNSISVQGCVHQALPNGEAGFDYESAAISHEFSEAITDPIPGQGWYDPNFGEIADICDPQYESFPAWNTHPYKVEKNWSNATHSCVAGGNQAISLSTSTGGVGSATTVTGSGFGPSETVSFTFTDAANQQWSIGAATTDASGTFSQPVNLPTFAVLGAGTLDATGPHPDDGASSSFTLNKTHRPDELISLTKAGPWIGEDSYDSSGLSQTVSKTVAQGKKFKFWVKVENDGNVRDTFTIHGPGPISDFTTTYQKGTADLTDQIERGLVRAFPPGASFVFSVTIGVQRPPHHGTFSMLITTTSGFDPSMIDGVVGTVQVK